MTASGKGSGRRGSSSRRTEPEELSGADYVMLVALLAVALIGTAMMLSWLAERQGFLKPGTSGGVSSEPADVADGGMDGSEPTL